jgi:uncharacterized protein DUF2252
MTCERRALLSSSARPSDGTRKSLNIDTATRLYEAWLARHTPLYRAHLALKHMLMRESVFAFLRATFYRWMQLWPEICGDLVSAPSVLAVGDLHVENFGTWRDIEGRLVWGINDFDEAYPVAYTNDLVRLASSALLAIGDDQLTLKPKEACEAILKGYAEGLDSGGRPFVLAEQHKWLRAIAVTKLRDPVRFWRKLETFPRVSGAVPANALKAIESLMPERGLSYRMIRRVSGLGSLGRHRFVAIANWHGGQIAREAKALAPSACVWAINGRGADTIFYQLVLDKATRCRDPFVRLERSWIVRRLSPDCSRIELVSLPKERDEYRILHNMGWETANIHLGSVNAISSVRRDLTRRSDRWLHVAAKAMIKALIRDWKNWKRSI